MAGNTTKLKSDIQKAVKDGAYKAMKSTFNDTLSGDNMIESVSSEFAKVFAENINTTLTKAINEYIKTIEVEHVLVAPNGTVTGTIKLV